jgi:predicted  nucleic acid-binding Zn-ribbon protein
LKEQLQLLERLQEIDVEIDRHEDELNRLPREAQEIARSVVALRREISEGSEKLSVIEKEQRKREQDLAIEQEKIKRSEKRLLSIKNQKEHGALTREIKLGKKITGEIEDALFHLMGDFEGLKKSVDRKQAEYNKLEEDLVATKSQADNVCDSAKEAVDTLKVERLQIAEQIDRDFLKRYEIVKKARGRALAEVEGGSCKGCYIILPPQLNIRILKQEEFILCPNCNRILYVKPENIPEQNKLS